MGIYNDGRAWILPPPQFPCIAARATSQGVETLRYCLKVYWGWEWWAELPCGGIPQNCIYHRSLEKEVNGAYM